MSADELACWVMNREGLALATRIQDQLKAHPWVDGAKRYCRCVLFAPERFAKPCAESCAHIRQVFQNNYTAYRAHIFIGALGIAVRFVAPLLIHKKQDPPLVVLDAKGRFVVSALSGHLGSANSLSRALAILLKATPVITTASDSAEKPIALDLLAREAGLVLLDWDELPALQGRLLEGEILPLFDPCSALADPSPNVFWRISSLPPSSCRPHICVHWRALPKLHNRLRLVIPHLALGIGCKREVRFSLLSQAVTEFCLKHGLEQSAIGALATLEEKAHEPCLNELASRLDRPLLAYAAALLAKERTPNPSSKAGEVFQKPPFSVAEASALQAARALNGSAKLLVPKECFFSCITLSLAGSQSLLNEEKRNILLDESTTS